MADIRTKRQTTIHKALCRKLKVEQREYKQYFNFGLARYGIFVSKITMYMVNLLQSRYCPFLIYDLPLKCNTTGATRGAGTAYTLGSPEFTPVFKEFALFNL
jgi:hypothetical protein